MTTAPMRCARLSAWLWSGKHLASLPSTGCCNSAGAPSSSAPCILSNSIGGPTWLPCTFNLMTQKSMMNSQNPKNGDLHAQLHQLGLNATAEALDDFIARATKARWSAQMILEEL